MIKANQLRIGNAVCDPIGLDKMVSIEVLQNIRKGLKYTGIPISPDILEKCGLKKELFEMSGCEVWHVPNTLWRVARSYRDENEYKLWHERISPPTWNLKTLAYLHELQNIIYALTGNEIKFNP